MKLLRIDHLTRFTLSVGLLLSLLLAPFPTLSANAATNAYFPHSFFAVTANNNLVRFSAAAPSVLSSNVAISGLQAGENIVGMDVRPANGQLYGLGSSSRLYQISPSTGVAVQVGSPFTTTLSGSNFGFDFNPVVDRIRVVSDSGQNLRLNPNTGTIAGIDTPLSPGTPQAVAAAYTHNFTGTTTTTLYVIDTLSDTLQLQGGVNGPPSPNGGVLSPVGSLGVETSGQAAFDIAAYDGIAYAALNASASPSSQLYTLNLTTGAATLVGSIGGGQVVRALTIAPPPPSATQFFGLTVGNNLLRFSAAAPNQLSSSVAINGLQTGESLLGIDVRPANGQLYGLGSSSRLYQINPVSGTAIPVGTSPFTTTLSGTNFGFDFNPVVDRIRVVSDSGQNLRLNPNTGTIAGIDTALSPGTPQVVGVAYTDNFSGTTRTTLYAIDTVSDTLQLQGGLNGPPSPNGGVLTPVGPLGINTTSEVGFDIALESGLAFAALNLNGTSTSRLVVIDLTTGAATGLGAIGGGEIVRDLTAMRLPALQANFFAVTTANNLLRFSGTNPGATSAPLAISGLQAGENILGIDVRPATGQLYGLGSSSRLYRIDAASGAATLVGSNPFTLTLSGTSFGFDFNPVVDRIRVVSNSGQNLRLHPDTGRVAGVDTALSPATAQVAGAAYTENFTGTTQTTLYVLDAAADSLQLQGGLNGVPSPNGGLLTTVGSLGVDADSAVGFDIATQNGIAFAVFNPFNAPASQLYTINLTTGVAQWVGQIGGNEVIRGLTVAPQTLLQSNFYGLTTSNNLVRFNGAKPNALREVKSVSGLQPGESLLGIDVRPANGQIYGLGSSSRLYQINPMSGSAVQVGTGTFTTTLSGTNFGIVPHLT